ncbi:immune-associated nucleotide-binding protein 9 isoform X1 [Lactuca sativa]|uniref:immune-associated nucleotide-binding protein 9 isoform X1 n=1 Tax=Lactuca sativa TaxID=4236 RepID=UPI0022AF05ED|nr:immune-associated nucleotide-binding protein 9 isoform X1 [Lactuca sativa]
MMGGCSLEDDYEYISPDLTLVLVVTGNGKTATGNSIVGMDVFESKPSSFGVTADTSLLRKTMLTDGRMLNVIDTHGLFDSSVGSDELIEKEIVSCMNMGTNGVHAVLVVFSVSCGFSEEEEAVIGRLLSLFGGRIYDYMIIVFTGGDELASHCRTFDDFLYDCPETLKKILCFCGNRCVLFDNMTKNQTKKGDQVQELLSLVNMVLEKNGGRPCKEMYTEFKGQAEKFQSLKVTKQYTEDELLLLLENMFEGKFMQKNEMFERLELLLGKERDARLTTEEAARTEQKRLNEEIENIEDSLDMMQLNLLIVFFFSFCYIFV